MDDRKYLPQLDSLRALAVVAVACHHWLPNLAAGLPLANGVQLFFVLSGFLITGILLDAGNAVDQGCADRSGVLRNFYARRFLRIFPLYYLVLLLATLLNVSDLRSTFAWHVLYLSNFCFLHQQHWAGSISHFWTLAVEEQFYLFWPMLVLFMPRRWLPACLWILVALGPVYRATGILFFPQISFWHLGTPSSFDSLALGALLAWYDRYPTAFYKEFLRHRVAIFVGSAACYAILRYTNAPAIFSSLQLTTLSIAFCIAVQGAAAGFAGLPGRIMNAGPLQYIGRISYGMYILHNFSYFPTVFVLDRLGVTHPFAGAVFLLNALFTFAAAALSWHYFERPINGLKRHFPQQRGAVAGARRGRAPSVN